MPHLASGIERSRAVDMSDSANMGVRYDTSGCFVAAPKIASASSLSEEISIVIVIQIIDPAAEPIRLVINEEKHHGYTWCSVVHESLTPPRDEATLDRLPRLLAEDVLEFDRLC